MVETRLELTSGRRFRIALTLALGGVVACGPAAPSADGPAPGRVAGDEYQLRQRPPQLHRCATAVLFVWDGLRPDSIDPRWTPNLALLRDTGAVDFRNHHAVYPTFTMMNAAAFIIVDVTCRHIAEQSRFGDPARIDRVGPQSVFATAAIVRRVPGAAGRLRPKSNMSISDDSARG